MSGQDNAIPKRRRRFLDNLAYVLPRWRLRRCHSVLPLGEENLSYGIEDSSSS